ncbi:MAG: hypothetical protein ACPHVN_00800 [Luminiphilus sp.]
MTVKHRIEEVDALMANPDSLSAQRLLNRIAAQLGITRNEPTLSDAINAITIMRNRIDALNERVSRET